MPVIDVTHDVEALSLVLTAEFPVTPERLWQVWADPRQLERWWGPPSHPATVTEHDLRPGGVVEYHMTGPHGETFPGGWEVTAVEEPRHLELRDFFADDDGHRIDSAPISTTTVEITEIEGGEARMVTTSTYDSEQALQTVLDMGAAEGSRLAAGQLDDLLAT